MGKFAASPRRSHMWVIPRETPCSTLPWHAQLTCTVSSGMHNDPQLWQTMAFYTGGREMILRGGS